MRILRFLFSIFKRYTKKMSDFADIPDVPVAPESTRVNPNQVATGMTRGIQQLGSEKVYSDGGNQQIIVEDSNEPRVLMGNHATFGEGFYVSKDGYNVKTNTNPANFVFNSSQNVFKIANKFTLNISQSGGGTGGTGSIGPLVHNSGYVPLFFGAINISTTSGAISTGVYTLPYLIAGTGGTAGTGLIFASLSIANVDSTNAYFNFFVYGSATLAGTITLYALQETAT